MLMIRFQRIGRKNDPAFRMVVLEKTASPKAGTYTDLVGTYNPKTKAFTADGERIKGWIAKGAQVSPSLMNLLITKGIVAGKKVQVISKTNLEKNLKKEAPAEVAPAATEETVVEEAIAEAEPVTDETPVAEVVSEEPAAAPAA